MDSYLKRDRVRRPLRLIYYALLLFASSAGFFTIMGSLALVSTWVLFSVLILLGVGALISWVGVFRDSWRWEMVGLPLLAASFADVTALELAGFLVHPTAGLVVATLFYGALIFNALIRYSEVRELRRIAKHYTAETRA